MVLQDYNVICTLLELITENKQYLAKPTFN